MIYRREIDGLRAIAVVPVIFYHAGFDFARGGYVGVDVFFVISGYLITSLIIEEKQAGVFSLASFYERRMRRLLPALFVVLFATSLFAWILLPPQRLFNFGASVVATTLFVSNFFFWRQTDYFAPSIDELPLIHTWSLAVEEQYYALFPFVLALGWVRGVRGVTALVSVVALTSLAWCEIGWREAPEANFYLITGRAWELMLGALAALAAPRLTDTRAVVREGAAVAGSGLIGFAIVAFDDSLPFPSSYTLVPTLGCVLLVLFATANTWVGRVLGSPPLVGVGLVSYGAYLWHQPLLVFVREYSIDEPSYGLRLATSGAALVLAVVTWRFVEKPFRDRKGFSRSQILRFAFAASSIFIALGLVFIRTDGMPERFPNYARLNAAVDRDANTEYVVHRFNLLRDKPFDAADPRPRALIVGDSFAEDFVNALYENGLLNRYQVQTRYVPARCQIVAMDWKALKAYVEMRDWYTCERADTLRNAQPQISQADLIVLAGSWNEWSAQRVDQTVASMHLGPHQKLLVVGPKSFGKISVARYYRMSPRDLFQLRHVTDVSQRSVNAVLGERLAPSIFVDLYAVLCDDYACPLFTGDVDLISYDGVHLTRAGAKHLGELLKGNPALRGL